MKIAIISFITEAAAEAENCTDSPFYSTSIFRGTPWSQFINCDINCVVDLTCEIQHKSHLSFDSDYYTLVPSTHIPWLKISGVTCALHLTASWGNDPGKDVFLAWITQDYCLHPVCYQIETADWLVILPTKWYVFSYIPPLLCITINEGYWKCRE